MTDISPTAEPHRRPDVQRLQPPTKTLNQKLTDPRKNPAIALRIPAMAATGTASQTVEDEPSGPFWDQDGVTHTPVRENAFSAVLALRAAGTPKGQGF